MIRFVLIALILVLFNSYSLAFAENSTKPDVGYWMYPTEDTLVAGNQFAEYNNMVKIMNAIDNEYGKIPKNISYDDRMDRLAKIIYKAKFELGSPVYVVGKDDIDETPTEKKERIKKVVNEFFQKMQDIFDVTIDGSENRARLMAKLYKETPVDYVPENKRK